MCNISDRFKYFDKIKFYDLKEKDEDFIHIQKRLAIKKKKKNTVQ